MRKGQLSVETMIIYGLVLFVALSVIGGLIYFNVLDISAYLPNSCNLGGTGELKCEEMRLDASADELRLGIRNVGQRALSELTVYVEDDEGVHFTGEIDSGDVLDGTGGNPDALPPGEIIEVVIDLDAGDVMTKTMLKGTLRTEYQLAGGVVQQESIGSIRVKSTG